MTDNFFGNDSHPLSKTLKGLQETSVASGIGHQGNFFDPSHERDPHAKAPTVKHNGSDMEFNAASIVVQNASEMASYIVLNNYVLGGDCALIDETQTVDREDGSVTIFIKWLQPKGLFELGTLTKSLDIAKIIAGQDGLKNIAKNNKEVPTTVLGPTDPTPKKKKGSLKTNRKAKKAAMSISQDDLLTSAPTNTNTTVTL